MVPLDQEPGHRGRPVDPFVEPAVLAATLQLLRRPGRQSLTVEGIAGRAGVARTTIYRRYGSLEGIMVLLLQDRLALTLRAPETGVLRDDLWDIATRLADTWRSFESLGRAVISMQLNSLRIREVCREYARGERDMFRVVVDAADARGQLRPGVDGVLAVEAMASAVGRRILLDDKPVSRDFCLRIVNVTLSAIAHVDMRH